MEAPRTSRTLPMIDPTSEALTTSWSPLLNAKRAMISSGAFPNVTLRRPPTPGPDRAASSSVALPMNAAGGITARADVKKIAAALACAMSSTIAAGMSGTRRYGQPSLERRKGITAEGLAAQQVRALLDLGDVVLGLREAVEVLLRGAAAAGSRRGGRRGRLRRRSPCTAAPRVP